MQDSANQRLSFHLGHRRKKKNDAAQVQGHRVFHRYRLVLRARRVRRGFQLDHDLHLEGRCAGQRGRARVDVQKIRRRLGGGRRKFRNGECHFRGRE